WEGFERVGDQEDPERKIWLWTNIRVGGAMRQEADSDAPGLSLEQAVARLREALVAIEAYAREEKYDNFADLFLDAIAALDKDVTGVAADWEDARYTGFDAKQLMVLTALGAASVFGGMGSWNDLGGGETYDRVSHALYEALNDCTVALANSTFRG
ncbi:MAG: hypothetical protein ABMA14_15265, partial [Hyphomonadaceae bacterium]